MSLAAIASPAPLRPVPDPAPAEDRPDRDDPLAWARRRLRWELRLDRLRAAAADGGDGRPEHTQDPGE